MKNCYPTFPNPAGIGSGMGFERPGQMIPALPHQQIRLLPQPGGGDPVGQSDTMYNQDGAEMNGFNPWLADGA